MRAKLYKISVLLLLFLGLNKLAISCEEKNKSLDFIRGKQIELSEELPEQEEILELVDPYKSKLEKEINTPLCYNPRFLAKNESELESSLGNLLADICFEAGDSILRAVRGRDLDLAGFKHPRYHMFRSLWVDEPYVYAATSKRSADSLYQVLDDGRIVYANRDPRWQPTWHWHAVNEHWNYPPGDSVFVEVYSNCPEVELFVNGESAGTKRLADSKDRILKWLVPYAEGRIVVVGRAGGESVTYELVTARTPASIDLAADKRALAADSYDVAHLIAQLCDENGVPVKVEEREIHFDIQGDCRLLGVENGSVASVQDYQSHRCVTAQGRCLLILQSNDRPGRVSVTASAAGVQSAVVDIAIG